MNKSDLVEPSLFPLPYYFLAILSACLSLTLILFLCLFWRIMKFEDCDCEPVRVICLLREKKSRDADISGKCI